MGKAKRRQGADHGGEAFDWRGGRGRNDEQWNAQDREDDPLRDLRPYEDDYRNPAGDEYLWPDMTDEFEDDD